MPRFVSKIIERIKTKTRSWKSAWWARVESAIPSNRNIDFAYVPLYKKIDNQSIFVGSFAPEFYILANTSKGSLSCQILEREWQEKRQGKKLSITHAALKKNKPALYHALYREENGKPIRKTPFELAVIPAKRMQIVANFAEKEYEFMRDRQLPMPAPISKYRAVLDYLGNIKAAGLEIKWSRNIKLNIKNPAKKATQREKILHYIGEWASWFMSISAALAVVDLIALSGGASPLMFAAFSLSTYLVKKCSNDFAMYSMAEGLNRDIGWFFSKELSLASSWKKISLRKSVETLIYLSATVIAMHLAATTVWAGTLALPWAALSFAGVKAGVIKAAQLGFAGFFALVAAAGTWTSVSFTQRYFWGLSFWNNQICFDKKIGDALLPIAKKTSQTKEVNVDVEFPTKGVTHHYDKRRYAYAANDDVTDQHVNKLRRSSRLNKS
ncbi:MAG: hypothetical protein BGO43_06350 [Gammaproteobacteria bacterium 39-13]|nr:hypothetical protein [Gammaproteobacteria bacterium]OJV90467.1 MAG: hypothetical protein BGO43_06350 [Gammaproteobacteria bacterium 39-13]